MSREYGAPTPRMLAWVARQVHPRARVSAVVRLLGGITAHMDCITVDAPGGTSKVVLRRWSGEEWTKGLVAREAWALAAISDRAVPAPRLLAADEDGAATGVRCTLTSALDGQPNLTPADLPSWLDQLATTQAAIHAVRVRSLMPVDWGGDAGALPSPDRYGGRRRSLDWITDLGLRNAAREAAAGPLVDEDMLVHGDYQHFNVLWREGRLTGVVDWPHAATGNRGSDVGHCRLNLAVLFDAATAGDYLVRYERAAGSRVDRCADLRALLCFDAAWLEFIPRQVGGRAPVDLGGMPARVADAVRAALNGMS